MLTRALAVNRGLPLRRLLLCDSVPRSTTLQQPNIQMSLPATRYFNTTRINLQNAAEEQLIKILAEAFPKATDIAVVDVSGGCGSMYEVHVEAPDFANIRVVKQHQMVTKALAREIKDMHGIRISTSSSPKSCS